MTASVPLLYGKDAPADLTRVTAWASADEAARHASGLYADMRQFEAVTGHPWVWLMRAYDRGCGVELTAAQVRELIRDYDAVIEKNNDLIRAQR